MSDSNDIRINQSQGIGSNGLQEINIDQSVHNFLWFINTL